MVDNIPNTQFVVSLEDSIAAFHSKVQEGKRAITELDRKIVKNKEKNNQKLAELNKIQAEIDIISQDTTILTDKRTAEVEKTKQSMKKLEDLRNKANEMKKIRESISNLANSLSQDEKDALVVSILSDVQEKSKTHTYLLDRQEKMSEEEAAFFSPETDSFESPFTTQEGEVFSFRKPAQ